MKTRRLHPLDAIDIGKGKRCVFQQLVNATHSQFASGRTVLVGLRRRF